MHYGVALSTATNLQPNLTAMAETRSPHPARFRASDRILGSHYQAKDNLNATFEHIQRMLDGPQKDEMIKLHMDLAKNVDENGVTLGNKKLHAAPDRQQESQYHPTTAKENTRALPRYIAFASSIFRFVTGGASRNSAPIQQLVLPAISKSIAGPRPLYADVALKVADHGKRDKYFDAKHILQRLKEADPPASITERDDIRQQFASQTEGVLAPIDESSRNSGDNEAAKWACIKVQLKAHHEKGRLAMQDAQAAIQSLAALERAVGARFMAEEKRIELETSKLIEGETTRPFQEAGSAGLKPVVFEDAIRRNREEYVARRIANHKKHKLRAIVDQKKALRDIAVKVAQELHAIEDMEAHTDAQTERGPAFRKAFEIAVATPEVVLNGAGQEKPPERITSETPALFDYAGHAISTTARSHFLDCSETCPFSACVFLRERPSFLSRPTQTTPTVSANDDGPKTPTRTALQPFQEQTEDYGISLKSKPQQRGQMAPEKEEVGDRGVIHAPEKGVLLGNCEDETEQPNELAVKEANRLRSLSPDTIVVTTPVDKVTSVGSLTSDLLVVSDKRTENARKAVEERRCIIEEKKDSNRIEIQRTQAERKALMAAVQEMTAVQEEVAQLAHDQHSWQDNNDPGAKGTGAKKSRGAFKAQIAANQALSIEKQEQRGKGEHSEIPGQKDAVADEPAKNPPLQHAVQNLEVAVAKAKARRAAVAEDELNAQFAAKQALASLETEKIVQAVLNDLEMHRLAEETKVTAEQRAREEKVRRIEQRREAKRVAIQEKKAERKKIAAKKKAIQEKLGREIEEQKALKAKEDAEAKARKTAAAKEALLARELASSKFRRSPATKGIGKENDNRAFQQANAIREQQLTPRTKRRRAEEARKREERLHNESLEMGARHFEKRRQKEEKKEAERLALENEKARLIYSAAEKKPCEDVAAKQALEAKEEAIREEELRAAAMVKAVQALVAVRAAATAADDPSEDHNNTTAVYNYVGMDVGSVEPFPVYVDTLHEQNVSRAAQAAIHDDAAAMRKALIEVVANVRVRRAREMSNERLQPQRAGHRKHTNFEEIHDIKEQCGVKDWTETSKNAMKEHGIARTEMENDIRTRSVALREARYALTIDKLSTKDKAEERKRIAQLSDKLEALKTSYLVDFAKTKFSASTTISRNTKWDGVKKGVLQDWVNLTDAVRTQGLSQGRAPHKLLARLEHMPDEELNRYAQVFHSPEEAPVALMQSEAEVYKSMAEPNDVVEQPMESPDPLETRANEEESPTEQQIDSAPLAAFCDLSRNDEEARITPSQQWWTVVARNPTVRHRYWRLKRNVGNRALIEVANEIGDQSLEMDGEDENVHITDALRSPTELGDAETLRSEEAQQIPVHSDADRPQQIMDGTRLTAIGDAKTNSEEGQINMSRRRSPGGKRARRSRHWWINRKQPRPLAELTNEVVEGSDAKLSRKSGAHQIQVPLASIPTSTAPTLDAATAIVATHNREQVTEVLVSAPELSDAEQSRKSLLIDRFNRLREQLQQVIEADLVEVRPLRRIRIAPLTTFHAFNILPKSVQMRVWTFAAYPERFNAVNSVLLDIASSTHQPGGLKGPSHILHILASPSRRIANIDCDVSTSIPWTRAQLLQTCRTSQKAALETWRMDIIYTQYTFDERGVPNRLVSDEAVERTQSLAGAKLQVIWCLDRLIWEIRRRARRERAALMAGGRTAMLESIWADDRRRKEEREEAELTGRPILTEALGGGMFVSFGHGQGILSDEERIQEWMRDVK